MLIEFRVKNYKSFLNEIVFSMEAAPKQSGLDYSLMKEKIRRKVIKGLSSSVIYGPNAAGKTNIIGAMDTMRAIVLRGSINNLEESETPNNAAYSLELIPNNSLIIPKPVVFAISFTDGGMKIEYSLSADLGLFMDAKYKRSIICERLKINDEEIFVRENRTLNINIPKGMENMFSTSKAIDSERLKDLAINNLLETELFLTNGFKYIFSPHIAKIVMEWFMNKFMVVYRADSMQYIKRYSDPQKQTIYVEKTTNEAAKIFGINSNAIGYAISEDDGKMRLCSLFENKDNKHKGIAMAAEIFESYGTIRFVNIFPLVIRAIKTGSVLVVDEFDASIHPMALMSIINIFHNDEINIKHAQLIINTHNPVFLNSNLLRRDEIKFVERCADSHDSMLYALSDFGTAGENGVRKHEDYMKYYFIGRYGAIKNIDFSSLFDDINGSEEDKQ